MNQLGKTSAILSAILLLSACGSSEDTESTSITNSGIQAKFTATESGSSSTKLVAEFNVGGNNGTNIELVDGEYVEVAANGSRVVLSKDTDFLDIDYEGRLPVSETETNISFNLYRVEQPDVIGSQVSLASAFEISQPEGNDVLFSAANTQVVWNPSRPNQLIRLEILVTCQPVNGELPIISSRKLSVEDDGFYELNFGDEVINHNNNIDRNRNCSVDLEAIRETRGQLSELYGEGGSIKAYRERSLKGLTLVIDG